MNMNVRLRQMFRSVDQMKKSDNYEYKWLIRFYSNYPFRNICKRWSR